MTGRHREIDGRALTALGCVAVALVLGASMTLSCSEAAPLAAADDAGAMGDAFSSTDASADAGSASFAADASLALSATSVDFSTVACGGGSATSALTLSNSGAAPIDVTATTTGATFTVSPAVLVLNAGASAALTIAATVPSSAIAGTPISGALNLTTSAAGQTNFSVPLSVTPSGASLAFAQGEPTTFAFPLTEVGYGGSLAITFVNAGNAPATFALGAPSDARFSLLGDAGVTLAAGEPWAMTADFTANDSTVVRASSQIVATGATCASSLQTITFSGRGTTGQVAGWPSAIDFGPADCGGAAPSERSFSVTNSANVDVHITAVTLTGAPGFTTNAAVGRSIFANGGSLDFTVDAPAVPALASAEPLTATLMIQTDTDESPHEVTLIEEPHGAVLAFDTSLGPAFGSFGEVPQLDSSVQSFRVVNTGSGAANVTLSIATSSPFAVSNPTFALGGNGAQSETATFAPTIGGSSAGSITMTATGALCGPLPAPIPLSGTSGPAPNVTPTSLSFAATCGGATPAAQAFLVQNGGNANMTWAMSGITGAGASNYGVSSSPPPGMLIPGASAMVTVTAAAIPSPAVTSEPSAYAAQVVITTDVPFDPPHTVTLGETPLGDRLSFSSASPLRFGQVPIGGALTQTLTVANQANAGSPAAVFAFSLTGAGAGAYAIATSPNSSTDVSFTPTTAIAYPATVSLSTTDAVCSPLPAPLTLSGAGTEGEVALSSGTLTFGTDPSDPSGLVDCGKSGLPRTLTVSNVGNQSLHVTGLSLGKGTSALFTLSGSAAALPALIPIGGSATLIVTPAAVPSLVADPNDATPFSDTLTLTTDAPLDAPHTVQLVMQARGAVIADVPLQTTWTFASVSPGTIATLTNALENTGNASVSVALQGLLQPSIFGLQNNPTTASANASTPIVAQFMPPSASGAWSDQATLSVTPTGALCAPLPSQWTNATIHLAGRSP